MTKKSQARQQRDELEKAEQALAAETQFPNNNWEALNTLHNTHEKIFGKYKEMVTLLIQPPVRENLENIKQTTNLVKALASDVNMLKEQTERIFEQHKDKTGPAKNSDENFEIVRHFQGYEELLDRHELLCTPTALEINEHLNAALGKLSEKAREQMPTTPQIAEEMAAATAHRTATV